MRPYYLTGFLFTTRNSVAASRSNLRTSSEYLCRKSRH